MSYVIARTDKDGRTEIYMNRFQIDGSGEFRSPHGTGLNLPLEYQYKFKALHQMYKMAADDPDHVYEVREYLR